MLPEFSSFPTPEPRKKMKPWHRAVVVVLVGIVILAVIQIACAFSGKESQILSDFFKITRFVLGLIFSVLFIIWGAVGFVRAISPKHKRREDEHGPLLQSLLSLCVLLLGAIVPVSLIWILIARDHDTIIFMKEHFLPASFGIWFFLAILTIFVGVGTILIQCFFRKR